MSALSIGPQNDRVLLVVRKGDKKRSNVARAQLVAEAVGAFTENQTARKTMGLAPLTEEVSHLLIRGRVSMNDCI